MFQRKSKLILRYIFDKYWLGWLSIILMYDFKVINFDRFTLSFSIIEEEIRDFQFFQFQHVIKIIVTNNFVNASIVWNTMGSKIFNVIKSNGPTKKYDHQLIILRQIKIWKLYVSFQFIQIICGKNIFVHQE